MQPERTKVMNQTVYGVIKANLSLLKSQGVQRLLPPSASCSVNLTLLKIQSFQKFDSVKLEPR